LTWGPEGGDEIKPALSTTSKVDGRPLVKERMLLPSWKVDRWRFFTHLARRASICIKLIGSPYWLLLLASKRDGIPVARKEREREREREDAREIERAPRRETRPERRSALFPPSHPTPFLG